MRAKKVSRQKNKKIFYSGLNTGKEDKIKRGGYRL